MDALAVLTGYLSWAAGAGAGTLLLVANQPPAVRVGREVQTPFGSTPLTFRATEAFAFAVLNDAARQELDETGSVEAPFQMGGVSGLVSVFYGGGCHNLVFRLGVAGLSGADDAVNPPRPMLPDGQ